MTSLSLTLPSNEDEKIYLNTRTKPDLPKHVIGRAEWVEFEDPERSAYHVELVNGET